MKKLASWDYAHRGLHNKASGLPENSLAAFKAAVDSGYGAELDVHLLKDGNLAVIHDSSLLRTTGAEGIIEDLNIEDLKKYNLEGTKETIPTFEEVLNLFENRTPLIIELKAYKNNAAELCDAACKVLDNYKGDFCIESFDPRCIKWLKKHRPHIKRGQLSQNFLKSPSGKGKVADFILTSLFFNWLTRPHFVAHKFVDMDSFWYRAYMKMFKPQGAAWTLRTKEDFDEAKKRGLITIFEGFNP
jgi:glycerophosphoryl diester phosphodiesterase